MKQSMILLAAVAGAATAQNLGSCAQLCVNNMNMIANTQFACPAGDSACFCSRSNWAYGIRDCSQQACDAEQAGQAISYAAGLCQGVASAISSGASASPSAALTILNPALTGTASGEASATGSASQSAITTIPLVGTVTNSNGDVETTTSGFSTVYGSGALTESAASAASSVAASIASELSSGLSSIAESASSALASATESLASAASSATGAAGSAASSAASAAGSAASSAVPSQGAAAKVTGVPVAAGLAAAAWFLI